MSIVDTAIKQGQNPLFELQKHIAISAIDQLHIIYEKDEARVIDQRSKLRVESDRSYSLVHLENGKSKVVSHPLCLLEADLSAHLFFRIHRSHLVNLGAIQSINKKCRRIKLIDGTVLPVAEAKMESLIKAIKAFGD